MAIDHIRITIYEEVISGSVSVWRASYDPSDYSQGISKAGSIAVASGSYQYPVTFFLLDAPYGSHTGTFGEYSASIGSTTSLSAMFPGVDLVGKYIYCNTGGDASIPIVETYSHVSAPLSPTLAETIGRDTVELTWGAGSAGTNNSVTGYDVQYQDSADGVTWASDINSTVGWTTASGSPVTTTKISVSPPTTVGYYRRFRVRTRGSAGTNYYSGWVVSTNTLRRKWNAFSAWTDSTLTANLSKIRAVHLTELQTRVNTIRQFYGLSAYAFTTVTARSAKIARWATLIQEIRTAIDGITTSHAAWNTLETGKPRIAHITQLRNIIDGM